MSERMRWSPRGSLLLPLLVFCLFVAAEIALFVAVADLLGWWTLVLLLATMAIGVVLMRREWARAWPELAGSLQTGVLPPGRAADTALIVLGGVLLIIPGLLTDLLGLSLLLPFTRGMTRGALGWLLGRALGLKVGQEDPTIIPGEVVEQESPSGDGDAMIPPPTPPDAGGRGD